jgi:hypothetical protein
MSKDGKEHFIERCSLNPWVGFIIDRAVNENG